MKHDKYQVWEGEMEVQTFDEPGTPYSAVIIWALLGVFLFIVLLGKTAIQMIFPMKRVEKKTAGFSPVAAR